MINTLNIPSPGRAILLPDTRLAQINKETPVEARDKNIDFKNNILLAMRTAVK